MLPQAATLLLYFCKSIQKKIEMKKKKKEYMKCKKKDGKFARGVVDGDRVFGRKEEGKTEEGE